MANSLFLLLCVCVSAVNENLCPNPDLSEGLEGWRLSGPAGTVERVELAEAPAPHGVRMDGRDAEVREIGVVSEPFPVPGGEALSLGAWVRAAAGTTGTYKVAIEWLDADGEHIGYANAWTGVLLAGSWDKHEAVARSPLEAAQARILAGAPRGTACYMTDFYLTLAELPPGLGGPSLMLMCEPIRRGASSRLRLRIENRGLEPYGAGRVRITLPPGVTTPEPAALATPPLNPGAAFSAALPLAGYPQAPDAPIEARYAFASAGEDRTAAASTLPFITVATPRVTPTAELTPPTRPETEVKLGCYYFPVMLDWGRAGHGVRAVDYFEPLLGYYDESRPEVADWHITWAVEHGVSYFVFDWYYNQGQFYLNDALEKGFLGSRFSDSMEFCIDWCNEGHCQEYKPLDFSQTALNDFITVLCERYFVHDNYLRVDGAPVVLIHEAHRIINAHGGWEGCRVALEGMRQVARAHGHPGAYFVAVQNNPWLLDYGNGGFDAATAYAYGFCDVPWGGPDRSLPYEAVIPRHHECFQIARQRAVSGGMGYIPSAWVGWDDIARAGPRSVRTVGNDPAAFRAMMAGLPHGADPDLGLALYESWNEWGEGGQSEPGVPYGFGRLSAIRDALSDERGPYEISVPPDDEIAAMQTDITWREVRDMYWRRHARKLGLQDGFEASFDSQRSLWFRGAGDARRTRIEDGRLRGRSTGDDPVLHGPPLMDLKPESVMTVEVRMRSHAGDSAQLYWSTEEDQDWSEARSIELPLQAGEDCAVYRFDVAAHTEWRGTIRAFRLDPGNAPGEFALDSVRTLPR